MALYKIPLIMYLFSLALLFSGYYIDLAFGQNLFTNVTVSGTNGTSTKTTFDYLSQLVNKHQVDAKISIDLIFGDFVAVVQVIFGILTGEPISTAFSMMPNFDEVWMLAVRIIFTFGSVALWAYLVAGRLL